MSGALGLTVYSCEPDEAELFHELGPSFGIAPTITGAAVTDADIAAMPGTRCISVGHKSEITRTTLHALHDAGVEHLSTRSIGVDHIDLCAAARLGITVENAVYDPDGVADFTLMLILMSIRNIKEIVGAADGNDFRLTRARGKDLRDLTVGVVGVGSIGSAVITRLQGFGCRVLASTSVCLDTLLLESDVVTLHLPLNATTHHLIGHRELATMKAGAVLVNTGRGALVDTRRPRRRTGGRTVGWRGAGRVGGRGRALLLRLHKPTDRPRRPPPPATSPERRDHAAHRLLHAARPAGHRRADPRQVPRVREQP